MIALTAGDDALVVTYGVLAAVALATRHHERSTAGDFYDFWPTIWLLVAGFLALSSLGRAFDVVGQVGDATRSVAREDGWYDVRRRVQKVVVLTIVALWSSTVLYAALRTPDRRRRYVPIAVAVVTLAAFVLIRAVSLHLIDSVTDYPVGPGDVGIVIELVLLAGVAFGLSVAWRLSPGRREPSVVDRAVST